MDTTIGMWNESSSDDNNDDDDDGVSEMRKTTRDTFDNSLGAAQGLLLSLICRSIARERILLGLVSTGMDCASLWAIDSIRDQLLSLFVLFLFSWRGLPQVPQMPQLPVNEVTTWRCGWLASNGIWGRGGADGCQARLSSYCATCLLPAAWLKPVATHKKHLDNKTLRAADYLLCPQTSAAVLSFFKCFCGFLPTISETN